MGKFLVVLKSVVFILVVSLRLSAEPTPESQVQGEVRDASGAIVSGVKVSILDAASQRVVSRVTSSVEGNFSFQSLPPGKYILRAEQKDFTAVDTPLMVSANQRTKTRITLYPQGNNISVTVTAERWAAPGVVDGFQGRGRLEDIQGVQINTGKKNDVVLIDDLDANLAGNNQRQAFAKVPGISFWENDSSGVQLNLATRGLSPNRSWEFNTRQNGYDIASDALGYPEAYYTPPLEALERVEIVRGSGSLQYGTQFGGVVNFITKPAPQNRKFSLETQQSFGNLGLFDTYNGIGGTAGKWDYASYFHRRQGDGWRQNNGFNTNTGYGSIGFAPSQRWKMRLELSGMEYLMQQAGGLTPTQFAADPRQSVRGRNWFNVRWFMPAFTVSYLPSTRTRVQLQAFGLYGERNSVGNLAAPNVADIVGRNRQTDRDTYNNGGTEARFVHSFNFRGRMSSVAGGYRYFRGRTFRQRGPGSGLGDSDFRFLPGQPLALDLLFGTHNHAAYVETSLRLTNRLTITPGFRMERITTSATGAPVVGRREITRHVPLGGIGLAFRLTESSELYANYTQAYRATHFNDIWRVDPAIVVDPNLRDVRGSNSDLGVRGRIGSVLRYDFSLFQINYGDRIGTVVQGGVQRVTNVADSRNRGAEGYIEFDVLRAVRGNAGWGSLNLFQSTGFTDARYTSGSFNRNRVELAPRWNDRYGATYVRSSFSMTLSHTHMSSIFTNATNTFTSVDGTQGLNPAFRVWDLAGTYRFHRYQLRAGVNNLTDNYYFTRRATGYPGPGIIPADGRTVFVGILARF
ncbi:MAG: TonB-dependent receptor [Acidobacteria bacterium]|nr:TonB-dependent receptor [Acidobacteriota bacterium]